MPKINEVEEKRTYCLVNKEIFAENNRLPKFFF